MAKKLKPINNYPFWHLHAAEVLTAVYYVNVKQAVKYAVENKTRYDEEVADSENNQWVLNEKTGKPITFKQWQREYGAPWEPGWWWYTELNDEEAPVGGPHGTFEQACRAGIRKYGRGKGARHEVTYGLLLNAEWYLRDIVNLGKNCYGPEENSREIKVPQAEQLQAQWFELAVNGNWAELKRQWGFVPDRKLAKTVHATVAGNKLLAELRAKQNAREDKIPTEKLKAALTKNGFKYRQYEGQWQWWWADREWRNYVVGVTERSLLLGEARRMKLFGLKDSFEFERIIGEQTGHYGHLNVKEN